MSDVAMDWASGSFPVEALSNCSLEHILAEYDGPQLVTMREPNGQRFIAVNALEYSADGSVWIQAPISEDEWTALLGGALLRPMFTKSDALAVLYGWSWAPLQAWTIARAPDGCLPTETAQIPTAARVYFAPRPPTAARSSDGRVRLRMVRARSR